MTNERDNNNERQAGRHAQQDKPDQDKSPKGFDTKRDRENQEEAGKGKIATSAPGGSNSDD